MLQHSLVSILLHFIIVCASIAQDISIHPTHFVATLNSNASTTFTCISSESALTITMLVNGSQISSEKEENRGIQFTRESERGLLTIVTSIENNNTAISCVVVPLDEESPVQRTESALFLIQGILSSPSSLEIVTLTSHPSLNRLSWSAPFTLNVSDMENDISGYRVCFNLTATPICTMTTSETYEFLNIRLMLEFMVIAINAVGESNASYILHNPCALDAGFNPIDTDLVEIALKMSPKITVTVSLQQPPQITCHDVYSVRITSSSSTLQAGPFLPVLIDPIVQRFQLQEVGGLEKNRIYRAQLIAINENGETASNQSIPFSTYDIQTVSMSLQDAILRIECSFLENSVATGCLVTLCHSNMKEQNNLCTNLSIMGSPTNSGVLSRNFRISNRKAVYVITNVAVIEENGSIISIESLAPFGRLEVSADFEPVVTTVVTRGMTGGLTLPTSGSTTTSIRTVAGGVIGASVVGVLVVLLLVIFVFWNKRRQQTGRTESDKKKAQVASQVVNPLLDPCGESPEGHEIGQYHIQSDCTDVMQQSQKTPKYYQPAADSENNNCPPCLPPKTKTSTDLGVNSAISSPSELHQTLTQDTHSKNTPKHIAMAQLGNISAIEMSPESQRSQVAENITYAELDHDFTKKPTRAQIQDKSSVLYSEIKVEEIPPVLPQKKSRPGSNSSSCALLDSTRNSWGQSQNV